MTQQAADRNLLFGVLALQSDLINITQFADACAAWASRKDSALADLLVERGWLTTADKSDVERLLERKLKKHGSDVQAGLAAATPLDARAVLARIDDAAVQDTLSRLPESGGHPLPATIAYQPEGRERYTLTHLHAQGGIGQVWLAHDADLGRDVALKELRTERLAQPAIWARFVEEAKITGQLQHPGIVPVYELVRRKDNEPPFYTMRFIRGRTLSEASKAFHKERQAGQAQPLELRELLSAFVGVCNAVAYAHARGVIHRDLKGHNVVLGDFGEVMVIDWGLAKVATRGDGSTPPVVLNRPEARGDTLLGEVLGTPGYMAPEQAEGRLDLVNERSDVYSLGAILYEILTGQPPFSGPDTQSVIRQVIHETPAAPRVLNPRVAPALEAVCQKALARRPEDRYDSAAALADDMRRWLADEPVAARPEPLPARLARWGRHHKAFVSSAAVMLLVVAAALGVGDVLLGKANARIEQERQESQDQRDRANANFDKARQAVDEYFTQVSENKLLKTPLPGMQPLRQELLSTALKYYKEFAEQHGDDSRLQADLAAAYLHMGQITGRIESADEALPHLQKALEIYERLARDNPADFAVQRGLADTEAEMAGALSNGKRADEAVRYYDRAVDRGEKLVRENPGDDKLEYDLAGYYSSRGSNLADVSRATAAMKSFDRALVVLRKITGEHPQEAKYKVMLAGVLSNVGHCQLYSIHEPAKALKSFEQAVAVQEELPPEDAGDVVAQDFLSVHYRGIANCYFYLHDPAKCLKANQQSVAIVEKLARENPRVTRYQMNLAMGLVNLGQALEMNGQSEDAPRTYQQAIDVGMKGLSVAPNESEFAFAVAQAYGSRGELFKNQSRFPEAAADGEQAVRYMNLAIEKAPQTSQYPLFIGNYYLFLGETQWQMRQPDAARKTWQRGPEAWEKFMKEYPSNVGFKDRVAEKLLDLALTQGEAGLTEDMRGSWRRALEIGDEVIVAKPEDLAFRTKLAARSQRNAKLVLRQGKPEEALAGAQKAVELQQFVCDKTPASAPDRRLLAECRITLAAAQAKLQKPAEALDSLRLARAALEQYAEHTAEDYYLLACMSAQTGPLLEKDQPALARQNMDRAVEHLTQAVRSGYKDVKHIKEDQALDPLRSRADFKNLLGELENKE